MKTPPSLSWFLLALVFGGLAPSAPALAEASCSAGPAVAARANASSLESLPVNVFGRTETGWAFYEPLTAAEIGTGCSGDTAAFAGALERWQVAHSLSPTGIMDQATVELRDDILVYTYDQDAWQTPEFQYNRFSYGIPLSERLPSYLAALQQVWIDGRAGRARARCG